MSRESFENVAPGNWDEHGTRKSESCDKAAGFYLSAL